MVDSLSPLTNLSPPAFEGRANGYESFADLPIVAGPPYLAVNGFYLGGLFYEQSIVSTQKRIRPVFSLNEDRKGLVNCRSTFVALGDPTGYEWAIKYLKSWPHWERLMSFDWFSDQVTQWRRELEVKQEAAAVAKIIELSENNESKAQFQAAKFIADRIAKGSASKRGRPTKVEVEGKLNQMAKDEATRAADLARARGQVQ